MLAVDVRRPIAMETARWLTPAAGAAYVLAATVTFVAVAAERDWLALGSAVLGFLVIQVGIVNIIHHTRGAGDQSSEQPARTSPSPQPARSQLGFAG
jgi:hypothetical protein